MDEDGRGNIAKTAIPMEAQEEKGIARNNKEDKYDNSYNITYTQDERLGSVSPGDAAAVKHKANPEYLG